MPMREPELLPELQPPAGGLARLQARRAAREATELSWLPQRRLAYLSLLMGAGVAVAALQFAPVELPATLAMDRLLGTPSGGSGIRQLGPDTVAQALPSTQPGVRLYWTASLQADTGATSRDGTEAL